MKADITKRFSDALRSLADTMSENHLVIVADGEYISIEHCPYEGVDDVESVIYYQVIDGDDIVRHING